MPTCQAYKCTNNTGRTTKGKSFFKIPEPKNVTERKRAQQWLHNMSMGQDIKTFKFSRNSVLCEDHFHKDVTLGADTFASRNFRDEKNLRNFCISRANFREWARKVFLASINFRELHFL